LVLPDNSTGLLDLYRDNILFQRKGFGGTRYIVPQTLGNLINQQKQLSNQPHGYIFAGTLPLHATKNYMSATLNDGIVVASLLAVSVE